MITKSYWDGFYNEILVFFLPWTSLQSKIWSWFLRDPIFSLLESFSYPPPPVSVKTMNTEDKIFFSWPWDLGITERAYFFLYKQFYCEFFRNSILVRAKNNKNAPYKTIPFACQNTKENVFSTQIIHFDEVSGGGYVKKSINWKRRKGAWSHMMLGSPLERKMEYKYLKSMFKNSSNKYLKGCNSNC